MDSRKTTCPFCLNGCTSGVDFNGYQYRMHYFPEAEVNRGRLCPRGNSASVVVDHPERLSRPVLDGRDVTWAEAEAMVKGWLAATRAEELAIVYSRGRAADEVRRLFGLAEELGTAHLACGHIEPENAFNHRLEGVKDATLADVENSRATLLVGDVFNTSPVASWRMVEARYADRKSRLVVVDSVRTRQSGFAHCFIRVKPGTEPFALVALAALIDPKLGADVDKLAAAAGVTRAQLETAAGMLKPDVPGFVGSAMHTGRVFHPALHSLASQLVALASKKPFTGFRETALPYGLEDIGAVRSAAAEGKVRMLFWTGGLYPYSYAGLMPELDKIEYRVATAIFRPAPPVKGLVLPVTAELERASAGSSYWGKVERQPLATPLSGSRPFSHVLGLLGRGAEKPEPAAKPAAAKAVVESAAKAVGLDRAAGDGWLLLGEKKAIGLRGFFDAEDRVLVNPADARQLGVDDQGFVRVSAGAAAVELRVHATDAAPQGAVVVGANVHANRALFAPAVDPAGSGTTVPPQRCRVEKIDRIALMGGENPSVWL
jgi:formylmethanofuran dehydrogenase subunit D